MKYIVTIEGEHDIEPETLEHNIRFTTGVEVVTVEAVPEGVQLTGLCPDCKNPLAWEVVYSICPNHQYRPATSGKLYAGE